jgi:hypothetical protein
MHDVVMLTQIEPIIANKSRDQTSITDITDVKKKNEKYILNKTINTILFTNYIYKFLIDILIFLRQIFLMYLGKFRHRKIT